jgi:hypothetical protein
MGRLSAGGRAGDGDQAIGRSLHELIPAVHTYKQAGQINATRDELLFHGIHEHQPRRNDNIGSRETDNLPHSRTLRSNEHSNVNV